MAARRCAASAALQDFLRLRAAGGDFGGRGFQAGEFGLCRVAPAGQFRHPARGIAGAGLPVAAFGGDALTAGDAGGMLARQRVAFGAGSGFPVARGTQRGPSLVHPAAQRSEVGQRALRLPCPRQCRLGFLPFPGVVLDLLVHRGQSGIGRGRLLAERGQRGAGALQPLFRLPPRGSGALFVRGRGLGRLVRLLPSSMRRLGRLLGLLQVGAQAGQPVALLQPHRGGGRRARVNGIAIPPPDRAVA